MSQQAGPTPPCSAAANSDQRLDNRPELQAESRAESRPPQAAGAVLGIGTDIIECERIERMLAKHGDVFLARVYTAREIDYCSHRKAGAQHYAGRWAAKEAVLKSIGTGWAHGIQWTDVEVVNQQGGKPNIVLAGKAKEISEQLGIREIMISISHCRSHAVAYATALGGA